MTNYMTFIRTETGIRPVGIVEGKDQAIGKLVNIMVDMLLDIMPEDFHDDPHIGFTAPDYADPDNPQAGISIQASNLTSRYQTLTGYALAAEDINEGRKTNEEKRSET